MDMASRGRNWIASAWSAFRQSLPKLLLFSSSYAPLFAMLAFRLEGTGWTLLCSGLAAGSVLLLIGVLLYQRQMPGIRYEVKEVREAGPEAASYLATYLLPVVMVPTPGWRDVVIASIFLVSAAAIFLRSSVVQINPVLYIMGFQVLAVDSAEGFSGYLLTRKRTFPGSPILASRMGSGVIVFKGTPAA